MLVYRAEKKTDKKAVVSFLKQSSNYTQITDMYYPMCNK